MDARNSSDSDSKANYDVEFDGRDEESDSTSGGDYSDNEAGKFVRKPKTSSEENESSGNDDIGSNDYRDRYNALLEKLKNERRKKKFRKRSRRMNVPENSSKPLAEKIRGLQILELQKHDNHKEQFYAWLSFKSTLEANWQMYGVETDDEKLICLRTKCKGFIAELINSLQRTKPEFQEVWSGLETQFYAPIDSREETALFYQMKQGNGENIFTFFERVQKQAYLCDFSEGEYNKRIGEIFSRNCLHPAFFLGKFEKFNDLDKLKQHAKNFHVALPMTKSEPVLAIAHGSNQHPGNIKRKFENNFEDSKRPRYEPRFQNRRYEATDNRKFVPMQNCKFCGGENCKGRNCNARGKKCTYCQRFDHFEKVCFRKKYDEMNAKNVNVNAVKAEDEIKKWSTTLKDEREVLFKIGDEFVTKFLVDSGSLTNVINEKTFSKLFDSNPHSIFSLCFSPTTRLNAYGGQELDVKCTFKAWVEVIGASKPRRFAEFVVVGGCAQNLLGYNTGKEIKVAKVGLSVNQMDCRSEQAMELCTPQLPNMFFSSKPMESNKFPKIPGVQVHFEIIREVQPVKSTRRNIPLSMQTRVNNRLSKMLELGILERAPRSSRWISPMHIVPKANGDMRIVIDMRQPNRAIRRYNHAMPLIEELWDKFQDAKHFTKIDIKDAFHHIEIGEESRELTTFMADLGMLRFTRLAFGVTCAPELFQMEMERILSDSREYCVIFLDDILIFAKTENELLKYQTLVEDTLAQNNLTINEEKTIRNVQQIEFLGFSIKDSSIKPVVSKTEAIENFEIPKTIKELRSFLGMINHIQSFIPNLAEKSEPLRCILRKKKGNAIWGKEQSEAFQSLKSEIGKHLLPRKIFDINSETLIYTDASPHALGAVLVQRSKANGREEERMVACASKTLTDVERRYSQTQREALAAVWGIERFYYYLIGRKFILKTDANALKFIYKSSPQETRRVLNRADGWALRLEPYNFEVEYVKGENNIADPFSRLYASNSNPLPFETDFEPHILCYVSPKFDDIKEILDKHSVSYIEMDFFSKNCLELQLLRKAIVIGTWSTELDDYRCFENEYSVSGNFVWRSGRLIVPEAARKILVQSVHKGHATYSCMLSLLADQFWWPSMSKDIISFISSCEFCRTYGSSREWDCNPEGHELISVVTNSSIPSPSITTYKILEAQSRDLDIQAVRASLGSTKSNQQTEYSRHLDQVYESKGLLMHQEQYIVPKELRLYVMDAAHTGHPGKNTMYKSISRFLWWPHLAKEVEKYVKCCTSCTLMGKPERPEPILSTILPSEPWKKIAIDFFSAPLDLKSKILVVKDYYSRYLITKLVSSENSRETCEALNSVFNIFGNPKYMKSDNGPPFQSSNFKAWCQEKEIVHIHSTPLSPRENGLVERAMQGIKKALTAAKMENRNLTQALKEYVDAYNSWPHAVTLVPPSDLMFARAFRGNFPMIDQAEIIDATQEDIEDRDRVSKLKSKLYQDRILQAKMSKIEINDEVFILKKGETKLTPRFGDSKLKVVAKNGSQLTLQSPAGDIILRSVEHVTKYISDKDIENYHLEKGKAAQLSEKGNYEENKLVLVKTNTGLEENKEDPDNKEDIQPPQTLTDERRPSRQIRVPKRYLCAVDQVEVYLPTSPIL